MCVYIYQILDFVLGREKTYASPVPCQSGVHYASSFVIFVLGRVKKFTSYKLVVLELGSLQ
jgi:hypothetical protein